MTPKMHENAIPLPCGMPFVFSKTSNVWVNLLEETVPSIWRETDAKSTTTPSTFLFNREPSPSFGNLPHCCNGYPIHDGTYDGYCTDQDETPATINETLVKKCQLSTMVLHVLLSTIHAIHVQLIIIDAAHLLVPETALLRHTCATSIAPVKIATGTSSR